MRPPPRWATNSGTGGRPARVTVDAHEFLHVGLFLGFELAGESS